MLYVRFEGSPREGVEFIKDYIKDKIVYDLGAGDGSFAEEMQKYATRVIAVELDPVLAADCKYRGLEVINQDFMRVPVQEAEVIYIFLNLMGTYAITKKLQDEEWHGTLISHYYPLQNALHDIIKPDKIINVSINYHRFPLLIYNL
mgnify:CR=1 FL=1